MPHICTSTQCWPSSPVAWEADGTQWTNHGGAWDESLLSENFFDYQGPQPGDLIGGAMLIGNDPEGKLIVVGKASDDGDLLVFTRTGPSPTSWSVEDVTQAIHAAAPADPRLYKVD